MTLCHKFAGKGSTRKLGDSVVLQICTIILVFKTLIYIFSGTLVL